MNLRIRKITERQRNQKQQARVQQHGNRQVLSQENRQAYIVKGRSQQDTGVESLVTTSEGNTEGGDR